MAPPVELDRVSKAYEQKVAVRDLSLQIEAGTMLGLLGPNGAGKTSSIRMMVGITRGNSRSHWCSWCDRRMAVASRIYRVGILIYGTRPTLSEMLRWIKYS